MRKNYEGQNFGNFKVIGDTGTNKSGKQAVLVRDKNDGILYVKTISPLRKHNGHEKYGMGNYINGQTGTVGVYMLHGKYSSQIRIQKKTYYLGTFKSISEASSAYKRAMNDWIDKKIKPSKINRRKRDSLLPSGVTKTRNSTYAVSLIRNKKNILRKTFKTLPEAIEALEQAKQQLKEIN